MPLQFSTALRNARLDAIETTIGPSPILRIRSGAKPASCADADTGLVLATINLPADFMANAANAQKAMSGTWSDAAADAGGTAGHFRIYRSDGTTCDIQGTVTATGGGGDMTVDNTIFAAGQQFNITGFTIAEQNG